MQLESKKKFVMLAQMTRIKERRQHCHGHQKWRDQARYFNVGTRTTDFTSSSWTFIFLTRRENSQFKVSKPLQY